MLADLPLPNAAAGKRTILEPPSLLSARSVSEPGNVAFSIYPIDWLIWGCHQPEA
jgi:hypothetical protein